MPSIEIFLHNNKEELNEDSCVYRNLIRLMIEKYVRTRGHSYASRITKIYHANKNRMGKGSRTSLRDNFKITTDI